MKRFTICLLVMLLFGGASFSSYADSTVTKYDSYAEELYNIGVFKGTGQGFELFREPTRLEGLVMLLRLLGREDDALSSGNMQSVFSDVPEWGIPYTNYAYYHGLTNGIGNWLFGTNLTLNANAYYTFLLRALGYDDVTGDFSWSNATEFAYQIGLIEPEYYTQISNDDFLRDHVAKSSYDTLYFNVKDSEDRLIDLLIADGVIEPSYSNSTFDNEIQTPSVEIDVSSSPQLIQQLIGRINYEDVVKQYNSYYSVRDIMLIQKKLQQIGVDCGEIDGIIDQETIAAIVHVQEFYELSVTGILDEDTSQMLGIVYSNLDASNKGSGKTVIVTLKSRYLSYNNHVGNEWSAFIKANGEYIFYGDLTINIEDGESLNLEAIAMEDDTVMDYGSVSRTISFNELVSGTATDYIMQVTVRENRGRYTGNTALWVFNIEVKVL